MPSAPAEDPDERAVRELTRAEELYRIFLEKAGTNPAYAEAVRRSRDRIEDLREEIAFLEQGIAERQKR